MKLGRLETPHGAEFAVQATDGGWIPLRALGLTSGSTGELIERAAGVPVAADEHRGTGIADPSFLAPIVRPEKVIAIGLNYMDHIRETGLEAPQAPVVFGKFPSSINDPFGTVVVDPALTAEADYESELAVIIGREARSVSEEEALSAVFGYCVANDVSARDCQRADGQLDRSKSFDTFCPIGPWITTADEVGDPQRLAIRSRVNGETRQESSTSEMLFSVPFLIAYLSRGMTLRPGDVILTGTPHGVGLGRKPPVFLSDGDVVECEVEGLGAIRNTVHFATSQQG
jgi:2-keto-4-pentenoate hydratase/2-oxohepta-3-ene-1,7-dioic acid hydratase in catechol pathway